MEEHMREEQFDVLDCTGRKTGTVIGREAAHASGAWHGAFHCLIIWRREGRGFALFQKRSAAKRIAPGKFDVSVGGHYAAGEDAVTAGPREIREELGLDVQFADLFPVGRRVFVSSFTPGTKEYEIQDVFLLPRQIGAEELVLQREELEGAVFLDVEEGIALLSGKMAEIGTALLRPDGNSKTTTLSSGDFVPCQDNYYLKMLLLARRYLEGERELLVI
jgi:isopentenyldiphosphate isomerase